MHTPPPVPSPVPDVLWLMDPLIQSATPMGGPLGVETVVVDTIVVRPMRPVECLCPLLLVALVAAFLLLPRVAPRTREAVVVDATPVVKADVA